MSALLLQALTPPPQRREDPRLALLEAYPAPERAWLHACASRIRRELGLPADEPEWPRPAATPWEQVLEGPPSLWELPLLLDALRASGARGKLRRRRQHAAHATPPALAMALGQAVVDLGPLPRTVLDPACGGGALLLGWVAAIAQTNVNQVPSLLSGLHGQDIDPMAVEATTLVLGILQDLAGVSSKDLARRIVVGDALATTDPSRKQGDIDLLIANPPWTSYAGRASHRLTEAERERLRTSFETFAGYPCLQAPFLEATLPRLRPGGTVAVILPSSMAEAQGYAAFRSWVDRNIERRSPLPRLPENSFHGVNQPSFFLLGTRRTSAPDASEKIALHVLWPTRSADPEEALAQDTLARLLPALTFEPFAHWMDAGMRVASEPLSSGFPAEGKVAVLRGRDVHAEELLPASRQVAESDLPSGFWSNDARWRRASVLIRQTSPWPVAVAIDTPVPFLNSVLAATPHDGWPPEAIAAWLNTLPVRWLHYWQHLDARQGIPQVKLSHLRRIPTPPSALRDTNASAGSTWSSVAEAHAWALIAPLEADQQLIRQWGARVGAMPAGVARGVSAGEKVRG